MATLTVRNLPVEVVERIKGSARRHGRSMEQEVRDALTARYGSRTDVLQRVAQRAVSLPPTTTDEIDRWIEAGRDEGQWISSSTPTS